MIEVWRICVRRRAKAAFSGEGARLYGGRWNPPGVAVVYAAATLSLAALELFVNLDPDNLPPNLVSIAASIPDEISTEAVSIERLPKRWREYPAPESLQEIGPAWAANTRTAVLSVPSAVIPHESNYLLNPKHPQFPRIEAHRPTPFRFDARMWK